MELQSVILSWWVGLHQCIVRSGQGISVGKKQFNQSKREKKRGRDYRRWNKIFLNFFFSASLKELYTTASS